MVLKSEIFAKTLTIHPAPSHLPLCSISSTSITILPKIREFGVCVYDTRKRYAFYQRGNIHNMHVSYSERRRFKLSIQYLKHSLANIHNIKSRTLWKKFSGA